MHTLFKDVIVVGLYRIAVIVRDPGDLPALIVAVAPVRAERVCHPAHLIGVIVLVSRGISVSVHAPDYAVQIVILITGLRSPAVPDTLYVPPVIISDLSLAPVRMDDAYRPSHPVVFRAVPVSVRPGRRDQAAVSVIDIAQLLLPVHFQNRQLVVRVVSQIGFLPQRIDDLRHVPPVVVGHPGLVPVPVHVQRPLVLPVVPEVLLRPVLVQDVRVPVLAVMDVGDPASVALRQDDLPLPVVISIPHMPAVRELLPRDPALFVVGIFHGNITARVDRLLDPAVLPVAVGIDAPSGGFDRGNLPFLIGELHLPPRVVFHQNQLSALVAGVFQESAVVRLRLP